MAQNSQATTGQASSPALTSSVVAAPTNTATTAAANQSSTTASDAATKQADVSGGSGSNTVTITNTSSQSETIGEFLNGGSTTQPVAEITLKPGETGTLSYANGQGGYMAKADSSGTFQSTASRLEFYADANGVNNTDVSYIDGRNASIKVSDDQGKTAGDTQSIAASAPEGTITRDSAGNATIAGWYDGSTSTMQAGGAYMEQQLGTGNAYIHPDDDQRATASNPMTMAQDKSQNYTASFGDA
ncbi:hypothetical protein [Acetobacter okinawensis]|nr:hypothetical protein [Acetobacter okinawensis]